MRRGPWLLLVVGVLLAAGGANALWPHDAPQPTTGGAVIPALPPGIPGPAPDGRPLVRSQFYAERDRFLAVTDPRAVARREATWLRPDDEVFGVAVHGYARAYPIPMIAYHHVVNDVIQGIPIAVTY